MVTLKAMFVQLQEEVKALKDQNTSNRVPDKNTDCFQGPLNIDVSPIRPRRDYKFVSDRDRSPTLDRSRLSLGLNTSFTAFGSEQEDINKSHSSINSHNEDISNEGNKDESSGRGLDDALVKSMRDVREFVYKVLPVECCPKPLSTVSKKGASEFFDRDPNKVDALPVSAYVTGAFQDVNKYLQGINPEAVYVPQEGKLSNFVVGQLTNREVLGLEKPKISLFKTACYKTHSSELDLTKPVPVDSAITAKLDTIRGKTAKPPVTVSGKQLEVMEKLARCQTAVASQSDFLLAAIFEAMNGEPETWDRTMMMRTLQSLSISVKHSAELAVRQVSNAVLLRRDAYMAAVNITKDECSAALRAQPVDASRLFNGKVNEAFKSKKRELRDEFIDRAVTKRPRFDYRASIPSAREDNFKKSDRRPFRRSAAQFRGRQSSRPSLDVSQGKSFAAAKKNYFK